MGEIISSISFQDNHVTWVQAEVEKSQIIQIQRAVESPLPFVINYDNISKPTTVIRIANHLSALALKNHFNTQNVRFLLSARFGLVKKINVDSYIPESMYETVVSAELSHELTSNLDDYIIYRPEYLREYNALKELLVFSVRKDIFDFFKKIAREAGMSLTHINLNCFSVDELFRRFYPNQIGQSLLVNFTESGFETVVSDETSFLSFNFKPYSKNLNNINQLDNGEIFSAFSAMIDDIQRPGPVDSPLYSISQVILFGNSFKAIWLDELQNICSLPLRILNPADNSEWQINSEDPEFGAMGAYRFVEPLSNIF